MFTDWFSTFIKLVGAIVFFFWIASCLSSARSEGAFQTTEQF